MQGKQRTFRMLNAGQRVVAVMALLCGVSGVGMLSGCGGGGASAPPSVEPSLRWLGTLPGRSESGAYGVSADGRVVVGDADNAAFQRRAFRWTASGEMQDLGTLGGNRSVAYGVSADGAVVVGWADNAAGQQRAFRWRLLVSCKTSARWAAMGAWLGMFQPMAPWWSAGLPTPQGDLVPFAGRMVSCKTSARWAAIMSVAYGVSADGAVVVGYAYNAAGQQRAFRWQNGVMQDLGTLGGDRSWAYGVSADGAVVVGGADNAARQWRAFRWNGVMQDLGTLGGDESEAYGVSADGAVVVGWADNAAGQERAFRWTPSRGMEDLNTTYASLLTNGSVLIRARAISPDGRYIVGVGRNAATGHQEAFLLDTGRGP
jgi:probable HAF family extracellular repeat protein